MTFSDSKPHYALLDGLRGVAALLVVWYHVFEGFQFAGNKPVIDFINHGYLAVDFFFILSGFVIGYAYDDRWGKSLTMGGFFRRRLIRLHPMVVMGAVIGAVSFLLTGMERWDSSHSTLLLTFAALLCSCLMIPALPGMPREVRGNGEMFQLNGPCWSLFFEYIGNMLYALVIHRMACSIRQDHRQHLPAHLPFPWRHILSSLHCALSLDVCLLHVAHQESTLHLHRDVAFGSCHSSQQRLHSMAVP